MTNWIPRSSILSILAENPSRFTQMGPYLASLFYGTAYLIYSPRATTLFLLHKEHYLRSQSFYSPDAKEGMSVFVEKRQPKWPEP